MAFKCTTKNTKGTKEEEEGKEKYGISLYGVIEGRPNRAFPASPNLNTLLEAGTG
jgi:hypothetical protein